MSRSDRFHRQTQMENFFLQVFIFYFLFIIIIYFFFNKHTHSAHTHKEPNMKQIKLTTLNSAMLILQVDTKIALQPHIYLLEYEISLSHSKSKWMGGQ